MIESKEVPDKAGEIVVETIVAIKPINHLEDKTGTKINILI